jgi:branched-subunit amino acid ABC-type transport system permease component
MPTPIQGSRDLIQFVVFGIVTGSFLLLATLGFTLIDRVEKFLNIAHAQLLAVAAFTTWFAQQAGAHFLLAAAAGVAVTAVLGLIIGRIFYDPMLNKGGPVLLITSVGVAFTIQGLIEATVSPDIRHFALPTTPNWDLGLFQIHPYHFAVVVVSLVAVVALHLFLTRTRSGVAIRAVADNRQLAEVRGIDVKRVTRDVRLVASSLAGMAGVALGVLGTLTQHIAFQQILLILSVAIVAGLGSIYGVVAAAFILGIAMDVSVQWIPGGYRTGVAFAAIILVLLVRPEGLAGRVRS